MTEGSNLIDLGAEELAEHLKQARLGLEDVEEERRFTLGQTGMHIGAREIARMRAAWARDEARLRERIHAIEARQSALAAQG